MRKERGRNKGRRDRNWKRMGQDLGEMGQEEGVKKSGIRKRKGKEPGEREKGGMKRERMGEGK